MLTKMENSMKIKFLIMTLFVLMFNQALLVSSNEDWKTLNDKVISLYQEHQYEKAIPIAEKSLKLAENTFAKDSSELFLSLNNLALIYKMNERYEEAVQLYNRALKIAENKVGKDHPDLIVPLNNLAFVYKAIGREDKVDEIYKRLQKLGAPPSTN